ncbi:MAG: GTPase [Deltaproteobacteria bacterium]|nr:GTPase [Deltaproteobacteria bacterium]
MAIFNYKKREISAKIVYYGPALCGKTTNVQQIHNKLNPRQRGELVSLATDADRTLFFDFLPIELENVGGFKTRFQIYTVPGQVYYNSTRKAVLTGVDGVIFVADSQISMKQENLESLNNLVENLKYYNRDVTQIPMVMQYNKRDLDHIMSVEELNALLNQHNLPSFAASAVTGEGVLQALTACCKQVLQDLKRKSMQTTQAASGPQKAVPGASPAAAEQLGKPRSPAGTALPESPAPGSPLPVSDPGLKALNQNEEKPSAGRPPFAFAETEQSRPDHDKPDLTSLGQTDSTFKPEVAQIGKARLIDPYTVTLPLRLATDADQRNLLSVEVTFSITKFIQTDR